MYQIVYENVFNNFQDIVSTSSTTALVANIVVKGVLTKEEPIAISHNLKFFVPIVESSFINLCDYSDEDSPSLLDVVVFIFVNLRADKKQPLQMEVL
jgi:hypothetical protein